jgi:2-iminoacetate synthase ThiH
MTSKLVMERLTAAGLTAVLALRERGAVPEPAARELLAGSDTLLLGAAADLARRRELGEEATIFAPWAPRETALTQVVRPVPGEGGTALLRRVATLRLSGPVGLAIVVDFTELGLETAELALSFGASGLAGPMASRRSLPVADGDAERGLAKRREISDHVERAGYRPRFVATSATASNPSASDAERSTSAPANTREAHVGS